MLVEGKDIDEVLENIDTDEVIEEMLSSGKTVIDIEYGECKPFTYKGTDDCEWIIYGNVTLTDKDLGISWFEVAYYLYEELNNKDNK